MLYREEHRAGRRPTQLQSLYWMMLGAVAIMIVLTHLMLDGR